MSKLLPEPDFEEFDGVYAISPDIDPTIKYDYGAMARYAKKRGLIYDELTKEEVEQFRIY